MLLNYFVFTIFIARSLVFFSCVLKCFIKQLNPLQKSLLIWVSVRVQLKTETLSLHVSSIMYSTSNFLNIQTNKIEDIFDMRYRQILLFCLQFIYTVQSPSPEKKKQNNKNKKTTKKNQRNKKTQNKSKKKNDKHPPPKKKSKKTIIIKPYTHKCSYFICLLPISVWEEHIWIGIYAMRLNLLIPW